MVVFDGPVLPKDALQKLEDFSRKFKCDLELLHIGTEIFGGAEAIDKAVEELREKLGGEFHVTSTIVPLGFFKSRRAITIKTSLDRKKCHIKGCKLFVIVTLLR